MNTVDTNNINTTINQHLSTIPEALEDIKKGKLVIVVDDEDRENEGDFFAAAELITPEIINFMSIHGRGLICTPLPESRCEELDLHLMVGKSTDPKETAFTVSIDLIGNGVTTGISSSDRSETILALMDENIKAADFARPGHIFPLIAKEGGVLRRAGHTEAAIDLASLAGLKKGGVIVEILNPDGTMARMNNLIEIGKKFDIKIITIKDLIAYRLQYESLIEKIDETIVNSIYGEFKLITFQQTNNEQLHFALTKGEFTENDSVLVRVQSTNTYYDLFNSLIKGENPQLDSITKLINEKGAGVIVFINNVSDSALIKAKLEYFKGFLEGKKKKPTMPLDDKDLGIGAQILNNLGVRKLDLLVNHKHPNINLKGYGLDINSFIKL